MSESGRVRAQGIEEAPLGNEMMLFHSDSSKFFVLNQTMAFVWKNIETLDEQQIAEALTTEFSEVEVETATKDVRDALERLHQMGLLIGG